MLKIEQQQLDAADFKGKYFIMCNRGYLHKDGSTYISTFRNGAYSGYFDNLTEVADAIKRYDKRYSIGEEGLTLERNNKVLLRGYNQEGSDLIRQFCHLLNDAVE